MSDNWWTFDKPTPDEVQRDELTDRLNALQGKALDIVNEIGAIVEQHSTLVRPAGMGALGHISYMARQKANAIGREDLHAFADAAIGRKVPTAQGRGS